MVMLSIDDIRWVISGHFAVQSPCPLYPQKQTLFGANVKCPLRAYGALLPSIEKSRPAPPPPPPPISITQYGRPLADTAEATAWHPPRIMLARCSGDCIHTRLAHSSVSHPTATFSATAPAGPRCRMKPT